MSYVDLMIQRSIQALDTQQGVEHDWSDLSTYDFNDPVSLITEEPTEPKALDFAQAEPFIDKMTSTPRERKQGQETFDKSTPGSSAAFQAAQVATGLEQMTTGDFARKMLARKGMEYEWGGTTAKTGYDCSGIIQRIMTNNGFGNFPRTSGEIYAHSKKISVEKAIKTRGAILWTDGHIAVSLGNGKTIEARGEDYGVVVADAKGRFTGGGLLPELVVGSSKGRSGKRQKAPKVITQQADPLNRLDSVSSLNAAPMVFGSIWGEVQERPTTKQGWESALIAQGLGFAPANRRAVIQKAAAEYGIPARLLASLIAQESGFQPHKEPNEAGAVGPAQVIPKWHPQYDASRLANNYRYNVMAGAEIFASYLNKANGNLRLALAYYNAGPNAKRDVLERVMVAYSDPILDRFYGREVA